MKSNWTGEATPKTAPKEIRTAPVVKSASSILPMFIWMCIALVALEACASVKWWRMSWKNPVTRRDHWMVNPVNRKLNPTELHPYRLRNVIKKPNPTTIMTCVSWNPKRPCQFLYNSYRSTLIKVSHKSTLTLTHILRAGLIFTPFGYLLLLWKGI